MGQRRRKVIRRDHVRRLYERLGLIQTAFRNPSDSFMHRSADDGAVIGMGFWTTNIAGALVRWGVVALIGGVCLAFGFSPEEWVKVVLQNPPEWVSSPWTRLAAIFVGLAVLVFADRLLRRLGSSAIDRRRKALIDNAFKNITPDAREWLAVHYAGGRPPEPIGLALNAVHLIDRDFVGWTEVKADLKPLVADKIRARESVVRIVSQKVLSMTTMHVVVLCLIASILFAATALFLLFWDGRVTRTGIARQVPPETVAHLKSQASAPIARLAELGWTVTPQPDKLQFGNTGPKLPDMAASAVLFDQLDRPFVLQLQSPGSLDGLRLLAKNPKCIEVSIGAGEFTDTSELSDFQHISRLVISQTPLNGRGILDAAPLGKLTDLRELILNSSRVRDASFLSSLVHLETLNLGQTLVADISAVAGLSKLKSFDVRGTRVADLKPLRQSLLLEELQVGGAQMATLEGLTHLDRLRTLRVIEDGEVDFSRVGSLVSLEDLFIWGAFRVDVASLRPLQSLRRLSISGFGFQQMVSVLENDPLLGELKRLESLTLSSLRVSDLRFLEELSSLTTLNLNEISVNSIEPVRHLKSLKHISLTSVPVVDISPLIELPELEDVRIMRTPARADAVGALEKRGVKVTVY